MNENQKPELDRDSSTSVRMAVASIAASLGGMNEMLSNHYFRAVRSNDFARRQLDVMATGADFWVGASLHDSRAGKPAGETVAGKHFTPPEQEEAARYARLLKLWVDSGSKKLQLYTKTGKRIVGVLQRISACAPVSGWTVDIDRGLVKEARTGEVQVWQESRADVLDPRTEVMYVVDEGGEPHLFTDCEPRIDETASA